MKRYGFLFDEVVSWQNLHLAWAKVRRSRATRPNILAYERSLEDNLNQLRHALIDNSFRFGNYSFFTVYEPKERQICAADLQERIVHHALMNVCGPIFEQRLIFDTYATRKGKGTYAAIERAEHYLRKKYYWAKMDVRKYFDSVSHSILFEKLQTIFKDPFVLRLLGHILASYQSDFDEGLPIGNLTSQYFANFYLSSADYFAKQNLKIPGYVRYMDDILFFSPDKTELQKSVELFRNYLAQTLLLYIKPVVYGSAKQWLPFLGYRLLPYQRDLNSKSKRRFALKYRLYYAQYRKGLWTENQYVQHLNPLFAFVQQANSKAFRINLVTEIEG